ncbi:MAG: hypothetical protein RIQ60_2652 [Pseudomonadota bacterium]|jgi:Tfp pilus assembly protein PilX
MRRISPQPALRRAVQPSGQSGGGTLALLLVMLLGATLMLLYLNRTLIAEQRAAALQWRSTVAFEAAEAGRQWAMALLNHDQGVDESCRPVTAATAASAAPSLRERLIERDVAGRVWRPSALQPTCTLGLDGSLACSCAVGVNNAWPSLPGSVVAASGYRVSLRPGPRTGSYVVESLGCVGNGDGGAGRCDDPARSDAQALVRSSLATLSITPALASATVVARGAVNLSGAVTIINVDAASGGLAIDSGAALNLDAQSHLVGPPGSGATGAQSGPALSVNPRWSSRSADSFFASHFALRRARLAGLPSFTRLDCTSPCNAARVDAALAAGARALWLDGSLDASAGPVAWGSAERPLLLLVSGSTRLSGASRLRGLLYTSDLFWTNLDAIPGELQGAVIAEGVVTLSGTLALAFDAEIQVRASDAAAVLAPVPGSWRDFGD